MKGQLKSGAKIFISTGAINLYTQSNILILSALTGSAQIGLYYGAERIRRAVQSLIGPAGVALFPRINNLMTHDRSAAKNMMMRMLLIQGGFTFLTSLTMFFVAPWGVPLVLGKDYIDAIAVVQWLSPLPFVIGISNVLGINIMLPLDMKNEFSVIVTVSAIINFLAMVALCPSLGAVGAAMSQLISEMFVTTTMAGVLYLRKTGRWKRR
jgi:O-antigen/teichoic acid export membrane protein